LELIFRIALPVGWIRSSAVVHLQAEDVVVLVRPGADHLGEAREPDP